MSEEKRQTCDMCKGSGLGQFIKVDELNRNIYYTCKKCNGIGTLNWLEMIFGVRNPLDNLRIITLETASTEDVSWKVTTG